MLFRSIGILCLVFSLAVCYKASPSATSNPKSGNTPTPALALAQPTLSLNGGTYNQPANVTVNASVPNATVCYTVSGSVPACDATQKCIVGNSIPSGWTIQVSSGILRVLTCAAGYSSSPVVSQTYALDQVPPANVSSFVVNPGNTTIQLSWTNPGTDFAGVTIIRKIGSTPTSITDGTQVYSGTGTTLTQTGLSNGTTYYYAAYSRDAVGNLSSGASGSAMPVDPPPGNASFINLTSGSATMSMTWSKPADADFGGVRVIRKYGSTPTSPYDGSIVYQGTGTAYSESGLIIGQMYCYGLYAYDTAGGYASGINTCVSPYFYAPYIGVSSAGNQQVNLYFYSSSTSDSAGVYLIRKAGSAPTSRFDGTFVMSRSEPPNKLDYYTDSGLTNGTTYYYALYAYNTSGGYSTAETTSAIPTIPSVSSFAATPGYNQNVLTWTNPVAANFQQVKLLRKATGYPANPSDGTLVYSGTGTTVTDVNLPSGALQYYVIFVYDTSGITSNRSYQTATPVALSNVTALASVSDVNKISLSWTNPADVNFTGVKIVRKTGTFPANATDGTTVYTGAGTTFDDTGLPSGITQYYKVFTTDCCSGLSAGATLSAAPSALPEVSALAAVTAPRQITLNWTNPTAPGVVGARVVRKVGSFPTSQTDGTILYNGTSNSFTDTNLNNDEVQFYRVFVYDGYSAYSSGVTLSSAANPGIEIITGWNKLLTAPYYYISDIKVDSSGNVYVTGYGSNLVNASSGNDWWIKKYSSSGVEDTANWDKKINYSGNSSDIPNAMAIDSAGNIYVVGSVSTSGWWLKKFSGSGVEDTSGWNKYLGGTLSEPTAIAIDNAGQIYVAGYGEDLVGTNTNRDWLIRKFSSAGVEDMGWNKKINGSAASDNGITAIATDSANNLYVAGYAYKLVNTNSMDDWWIKKFNSTGSEITSGWDKRFDSGSIYWERPTALTVDAGDNVYVTGYWNENSSGGSTQWLTKKFDSMGQEDALGWNKIFPYYSKGMDIVTDGSGNVFIAGYLYNKVGTSSQQDFAIKKYSGAGIEDTLNWDRKFDYANYYDYATGMAIDTSGNLYVCGTAGNGGLWIKKFNP